MAESLSRRTWRGVAIVVASTIIALVLAAVALTGVVTSVVVVLLGICVGLLIAALSRRADWKATELLVWVDEARGDPTRRRELFDPDRPGGRHPVLASVDRAVRDFERGADPWRDHLVAGREHLEPFTLSRRRRLSLSARRFLAAGVAFVFAMALAMARPSFELGPFEPMLDADVGDLDLSGWTAVPTEPQTAAADAAVALCLRGPGVPREVRGDRDALLSGPSLHDQRGDAGALLLWIAPGYTYRCSILADGDGFDSPAREFALGDTDLAAVPLEVLDLDRSDTTEILGRVQPGAARVEIETRAGSVIEATQEHGWFVAWWPGDDPAQAVRAYSDAGSLIAETSSYGDGRFLPYSAERQAPGRSPLETTGARGALDERP